jgi:hypothetical protein
MTPSDISSLEYAIEKLESLDDGSDDSLSEHLARLRDLRWEAMLKEVDFCGDKKSLIAFMRKWAITIPMSEFDSWRMALPQDQRMGVINGLPESRGILRATNGILCYIERQVGFPYLGHIEHWQPEADISGFSHRLIGKRTAQSARSRFLDEIFG